MLKRPRPEVAIISRDDNSLVQTQIRTERINNGITSIGVCSIVPYQFHELKFMADIKTIRELKTVLEDEESRIVQDYLKTFEKAFTDLVDFTKQAGIHPQIIVNKVETLLATLEEDSNAAGP